MLPDTLMAGPAAYPPALGSASALGDAPQGSAVPRHPAQDIVTSDLTGEEMWNLASLGYMPLKLVLGTAVCSLGLAGGVMAMFKGMARGEISELTSLIYEARRGQAYLIRQRSRSPAVGRHCAAGDPR